MKKLLLGLLFSIGLAATAQAAPIWGTVQIGTTTTLVPTLQRGSINIASGTIRDLNVPYGVKAGTGTFTGAVTAASFSPASALPGGNTSYIQNGTSLQANSAFNVSTGTVSSGTITNLAITTGTAGQMSISSGSFTNIVIGTGTAINLTVSSGVVNNFTASTATVNNGIFTLITVTTITPTGIVGTTTNNNANVGNYGEYRSSVTTNVATFSAPTSNQYGDLISFSLPAGDWDITAIAGCTLNGATQTELSAGISVTSGNNSAGLSFGDTLVQLTVPAALTDNTVTVPAVRMSLSSLTTVYLKIHAIYTGGPPKFYGRISARRVR